MPAETVPLTRSESRLVAHALASFAGSFIHKKHRAALHAMAEKFNRAGDTPAERAAWKAKTNG